MNFNDSYFDVRFITFKMKVINEEDLESRVVEIKLGHGTQKRYTREKKACVGKFNIRSVALVCNLICQYVLVLTNQNILVIIEQRTHIMIAIMFAYTTNQSRIGGACLCATLTLRLHL